MSEGKREKKREFPEAPPKRFSKRGKTLPPLSLSPFLSYLHRHHHRARLLRLVPRHDGEDGVGVQSRDPLVFARKGLARPAARGLGHEDDEAVRVGGERGVELLGAVDLSYFCGVETGGGGGGGGQKKKKKKKKEGERKGDERSSGRSVRFPPREKRKTRRRRRRRRARSAVFSFQVLVPQEKPACSLWSPPAARQERSDAPSRD